MTFPLMQHVILSYQINVVFRRDVLRTCSSVTHSLTHGDTKYCYSSVPGWKNVNSHYEIIKFLFLL